MSEYHKIETLFERDERFKVRPDALKSEAYGLVSNWLWTEKVDGTNMRLIWSHANRSIQVAGKTDAASLHPHLIRACTLTASETVFASVFPERDVVVYGEGYGAGIQKGGGQYAPDKRFIAFDVFVADAAHLLGGWWLSPSGASDACGKLGLPFVPAVGGGNGSLSWAVEAVRAGIPSIVAEGRCQMEGLVGRPPTTMYDSRGKRIICKIKTRDF